MAETPTRGNSRRSKVRSLALSIYQSDSRLQLALLIFMLLWYSVVLWVSWRLTWPITPLNLTFNSMLDHLLHGQFDVDPQVVGPEGFLRDGRTYSYFGIWCALLRLPLWIFHRMDVDLTLWSCLAAVCLATMAKVRAVLLLRRHGGANPNAHLAVSLMLAYVLLGGSAVAYLAPSIYQEVMFWAMAFAAVFVYFAVKGIVTRSFDVKSLCSMALCAGLALLTRPSTGVGLILALALLLLVLVAQDAHAAAAGPSPMLRLSSALIQRRVLLPLAILAVLIGATGTVNYFRWGNPATFADYYNYNLRDYWPSFLPSLRAYGIFNPKRIPFGLVYYFAPVWVLHGRGGQLFFLDTQMRLFGDVELPPGSFFLTDLLPLFFIALLIVALLRRRGHLFSRQGHWATAIAAGLFAPCLLMLSLAWLTYRYRMEFYPEIDFLAFLGLYLVLTSETLLPSFARLRKWIVSALALSIVSSLVAASLNALTGYELAQDLLRPGIVQYYDQQVALRYHHAMERYLAHH